MEYNFPAQVFFSQLYSTLYGLAERSIHSKYSLGYHPETLEFNVFDTKEELLDFANNVSEADIVEKADLKKHTRYKEFIAAQTAVQETGLVSDRYYTSPDFFTKELFKK